MQIWCFKIFLVKFGTVICLSDFSYFMYISISLARLQANTSIVKLRLLPTKISDISWTFFHKWTLFPILIAQICFSYVFGSPLGWVIWIFWKLEFWVRSFLKNRSGYIREDITCITAPIFSYFFHFFPHFFTYFSVLNMMWVLMHFSRHLVFWNELSSPVKGTLSCSDKFFQNHASFQKLKSQFRFYVFRISQFSVPSLNKKLDPGINNTNRRVFSEYQ